MDKYHKIQTVFKRDPETKFKTLLDGEYSEPAFEYLKDADWTFREKVDGTNIRIMWKPGRVVSCLGKSDSSEIPLPLLDVLTKMFLGRDQEFEDVFAGPVCLYGEGFGGKIQQAGKLYGKEPSFALFDVKMENYWFEQSEIEDIAQRMDICLAPVVGCGTLHDLVDKVEQGFNSHWGAFPAEGIVAVPTYGLKDRSGKRIITKLKHKDFV